MPSRCRVYNAGFVALFALIGCGRGSGSVVGTWEMRYLDAVGQNYLDVMELRADGTYITTMQGSAPSDAGQYTVRDDVIAFSSALDPRFSSDISFQLVGSDVLQLTLPVLPGLPPTIVRWQRSDLQRMFDTQEEFGRRVPQELQSKVMSLTGDAQHWRPDAVPTWINLEVQSNGDYVTTVHFFSAAANEERRIRITPFDVRTSVNDGSRTFQRPLPARFLDLHPLLTASAAQGMIGALDKADLQVWGEFGAVWRLNDGQRGRTYSADTGMLIEEDVTGYQQQYEADWNYAQQLWRDILSSASEDQVTYCFEAESIEECLAPPSAEKFCFWNDAHPPLEMSDHCSGFVH